MDWSLRHLNDHDFVVLKDVLDNKEIDSCRDSVYEYFHENKFPSNRDEARSWMKYKNKFQRKGKFLSLLNTNKMVKVLNALFPEGYIQPTTCQVCVRFPGENKQAEEIWHIDNWDRPRKYRPPEFKYIVGIPLDVIQENNRGNLVVYPGSERQIIQYGKKSNFKSLKEDYLQSAKEELKLNEGFQVKCNPGDLIVMKRLAAHTCTVNMSDSFIRPIVYYRIQSKKWLPEDEIILRNEQCELGEYLELNGIGYLEGTNHLMVRYSKSEPNFYGSMVRIRFSDKKKINCVRTDGFLSRKGEKIYLEHLKQFKSLKSIAFHIYKYGNYADLISDWIPKVLTASEIPSLALEITVRKMTGEGKQECMRIWAIDLKLRLKLYPGFPGKILVSGYARNVEVFKKRFDLLHWSGKTSYRIHI